MENQSLFKWKQHQPDIIPLSPACARIMFS